MSVENKLKNIINRVNAKTNCTHIDLNGAVGTLCDGYCGNKGEYVPTPPAEGSCKSLNALRRILYKANGTMGTSYGTVLDAVYSLASAYDAQPPLYTFGAVSDLHLQYATGQRDFTRLLAYFDRKSIPFTMVCGDLTWAATMVGAHKYTAEWKGGLQDYKELRGSYPLYACGGNHETYTATYDERADKWSSVTTGFDTALWQDATGNPAYYTVSSEAESVADRNVHNPNIAEGDVFVMLSIKEATAPNLWLEGEWEWLQSTLESNRDKRVFLFFHMHDNDDKTADPYGLYPHGISSATPQGKAFLDLIRQYKNVIWFHGHTHTTFLEEHPPVSNRHATGYRSVNIPSLQGPRKWLPETGTFTGTAGDSEAVVIEVYEHTLILKCLDMSTVNADGTGEATELERYSIATD